MDPLAQPAGSGLLSTDAELGSRMSEYAVNFVGVPYVAGGNNPKTGWDCAAFTEWIAQQHGLSIPPVSWQQIKVGEPVASLKDARAGDLVFFHEPSGHNLDPSALKVNHVGLYLGDGRMVEAANPSAGTRISEVSAEKLVGIRRLAGPFNG
jgi:cell wall-associated NlpC family hydrolase